MRTTPPLAARLLAALRESPVPVATGALAARCAAGMPSALAQASSALTRLERRGLVRRLPPAVQSRCRRPDLRRPGRPAWRWVLASTQLEAS